MSTAIIERINVTKSFIPPIAEYQEYVKKILNSGWLTNQGAILKKLEEDLTKYLNVNNLHFVTNGTIALQLALRALGIEDGEIITTPFSYVATVSSILWEHCNPIFVDINPYTLSIDTSKIEEKITSKTKAIMPVHVFGHVSDVEGIQKLADKYNLKVIYDAAHAFGAKYKNKSLLSFGDISTCSFHATKLFHTIEGGACIVRDSVVSQKIELMKRFGHNGDEHYCLGINAKQTEFNAAMGICILPYINEIIKKRAEISNAYDKFLENLVQRPLINKEQEYNYAYYPIILESENITKIVIKHLNNKNIFPRRYFYPSLNKLPYLNNTQNCPISEDISSRIICLPLYSELDLNTVEIIATSIKEVL